MKQDEEWTGAAHIFPRDDRPRLPVTTDSDTAFAYLSGNRDTSVKFDTKLETYTEWTVVQITRAHGPSGTSVGSPSNERIVTASQVDCESVRLGARALGHYNGMAGKTTFEPDPSPPSSPPAPPLWEYPAGGGSNATWGEWIFQIDSSRGTHILNTGPSGGWFERLREDAIYMGNYADVRVTINHDCEQKPFLWNVPSEDWVQGQEYRAGFDVAEVVIYTRELTGGDDGELQQTKNWLEDYRDGLVTSSLEDCLLANE